MRVATERLDRALNPRTVAVVGDKAASDYMWLRSMSEFQGDVYSVQIDPNDVPGIEAMGIPNYSSLMEIPKDIDYVVVAVPRNVAPIVLRDAIQKNVAGVGMFTSGFAETGNPDAVALQETITEMARDSGLALLGPNCMGLYNPAVGVRFSRDLPTGQGGPVTFVSQSGGHAVSFSAAAHANGIGINKVVSFGNGVVLENADYLEYFAQDDDTKFIAMYVEGVKDGRRFFELLRETTPKKPVIIWKGGQTDEGQRATSSHTGALAESMDTWDVLIRQCGAIRVDSMTELTDVLKALIALPTFTGDGVGLTGGTGGQSVSMTDAFAKSGLRVPMFSQKSLDKLGEFFQVIGASYLNPVDIGGMNRDMTEDIVDILGSDPNIDIIAMQMNPSGLARNPDQGEAQIASLVSARDKTQKPVITILFSSDPYGEGQALKALDLRLQEAGIPSYPTYERAALTLNKLVGHHRFHEGG
ncbi:MAG: CoA-binding protein [SAR202 cluster bacterium]|nr:CoA-binding protein [SAR202 cluster bacterium]MDP6514867.1 CoA-binding protein [SAR202 cluster bacterium]MDP6716410.1 CoA-binding protein [SAR202 cluster bacterium]